MARVGNSTAPLWLGLGVALGFFARTSFERTGDKSAGTSVESAAVVASNSRVAAQPQNNSIPPPSALTRITQFSAHSGAANIQELLRAIDDLGVGDCEQAFSLLKNLRTEDRTFLLRALSRRWAEVDAFGAARFVENTRDHDFAKILLNEAAPKLVQHDPQAALDFIGTAKNPLFRILNAHAILGELAKVDPARAVTYLAEHPEFLRYDDIYRQVARSYAQLSPAAAVQWAESLSSRKLKQEAVRYAWTAWVENDPVGAAAAFQLSKGSMSDNDLASALSRSWSALDPQAAREWIESLTDKRAQEAAWWQFRVSLDRFSPDQALELVNSISSVRGQTAIAMNVTSQLAEKDLPEALAWAERLPSGEARNQVLRSLVDRWAPGNPAAAVQYAAAQSDDRSRTELLKRAVGVWGLQDPQAALAWAKERPAGSERDEIASDALRAVREFDPARAISWLDLIDNSGMRNHAASEIVGEIAQSDGLAAARMADKLPEQAQPQAYYSVVRGWAFNDHEAAGNWINTLPSGVPRDSAISAYVSVIDGIDAGLATRWAMAIEEPQMRDQSLAPTFGRWLNENPGPAQAWLESAEESVRAKLQKIAVR